MIFSLMVYLSRGLSFLADEEIAVIDNQGLSFLADEEIAVIDNQG